MLRAYGSSASFLKRGIGRMVIRTEEVIGELNGQSVKLVRLSNNNGMEVACLNYGCTITEIRVPDRNGVIENVVLGFDTLEEYIKHSPYFGSVVGPVAGRITNSSFIVDGVHYQLPSNEGKHHLHGGPNGFDKVIWDVGNVEDESILSFTYEKVDGFAGYPGNLKVTVTYQLTNDNELIISYYATTDKKTVVNMTNHSYFNLSGAIKRDILSHELKVASDRFLPLNDSLIPTGEIAEVEGTAFDFREGRPLEDGVKSRHSQNLLVGRGYDHPLILSRNQKEEICLVEPQSGRKLTIETDEPIVVLYTSNMMKPTFTMRGVEANKYLGVCLETQHHPDAINHSSFPSIVLDEDEEYKTTTAYRFSIE